MILAHTGTDCPADQDVPDLIVGPGAQMTDGTDVYCVHDDPTLDPPDGTVTDDDGSLTPPSGWRFSTDGLAPVETE